MEWKARKIRVVTEKLKGFYVKKESFVFCHTFHSIVIRATDCENFTRLQRSCLFSDDSDNVEARSVRFWVNFVNCYCLQPHLETTQKIYKNNFLLVFLLSRLLCFYVFHVWHLWYVVKEGVCQYHVCPKNIV